MKSSAPHPTHPQAEQLNLELGSSADLSGAQFGSAAARVAASIPKIALDPRRRYPALQSSYSHRKTMEDCPRQSYEYSRREKGRDPEADPRDREIFLRTTLKSSPEILGHAVHEAAAYALSTLCGEKLGENQYAPSRIVTLDELLDRASRWYIRIMGLSAGASRLHFAADPERFPLLVEDVLEMNRRPLEVERVGVVAMHKWRSELWSDINTCITNFYTLFFAPRVQGLTDGGFLSQATGGFAQLKPGRYPAGDFLTIEGWRESEFSSDSVGAHARSNEWPHFLLPIVHTIRDHTGSLVRRGFDAKNLCILDFAYAEPERDSWHEGRHSPGRIVICDWKTNTLDPETNRPWGGKARQHLQQLSEYAVYMLELFPELTPQDIILRLYYLRGEGISAEDRVEEYSAASIDSSPGMAVTRERIRLAIQDRANRFFDPVTGQTELSLWPYAENKSTCTYCKVAGICDGAPPETRAAMNFDIISMRPSGTDKPVDEGI
ncbi:MAG: PD-(D/E)XK nuclease family protein [Oligoflexia bacterium]|nr:PD-(D/E)XK nuclease family protein [Oligoflexia bacterium]